jgi:hypothetical protein
VGASNPVHFCTTHFFLRHIWILEPGQLAQLTTEESGVHVGAGDYPLLCDSQPPLHGRRGLCSGIKRPRCEATITGLWRPPDPSDSIMWSWVLWDSEPRITMLARASSSLAGSRSDHHLYVESRLRMHGVMPPCAKCLQGCFLNETQGQLYKAWQLNKWIY